MDAKRIENLRKKIEEYIMAGGDIYAPRRELPYYEYMRGIKRALEKELERDVSFDEVYGLCGVNFDREYHENMMEYQRFLSFYERVRGFADKNGYVDSMRKSEVRKIDNTYEQLKNYADKYGCSPFDFLVLMTGFKFKTAIIQVDYVSYLSQKLLQVYPDGDIEGIRWQRPDLYEGIRHLRKYMPESVSMQEVAEILGVHNKRFSNDKLKVNLNKDAVLNKIYELCPDGNASKLRVVDLATYYHVIELARSEDKTPFQWMKENNFSYDFEMNMPRLSKAKVDADKRAQTLLSMREELLQNYDLQNVDDITRFNTYINVMQQTLQIVNNENYTFDDIEEVDLVNNQQSQPEDDEQK